MVVLAAVIALHERHEARGEAGIAAPQERYEPRQLIDGALRKFEGRPAVLLRLVVDELGPEPVAGPQPDIEKLVGIEGADGLEGAGPQCGGLERKLRVEKRAGLRRRRSEERRVGKGCVRKCGSRWSPVHLKKNKEKYQK